MKVKHNVQVEAIHASYEGVVGSRRSEDKSKADAMRVMMDGKVDTKKIKRALLVGTYYISVLPQRADLRSGGHIMQTFCLLHIPQPSRTEVSCSTEQRS